ncbi:hypothetical protein BU61_4618 [Pontoporia blainvillei]|uniref:DUF4758 domain-containing protein n=1 Tax=Pontoporia blainvillei TaxID=48723 RepID=A0ABX0S895_PONBL|nr:hypothetical protein [Pontoporia blainvillei]
MPRSGWACEPWPLSQRFWSLCSATGQATTVRSLRTAKDNNNNIPPEESNTSSVKANVSPTIIISTKGIKITIDNNKFGEKTVIEEGSQNSVHERRKIATLFDQEDSAAISELCNFINAAVLIPAVGKILPSGIEPNPFTKSDNNKDDPFTVEFDATHVKPQTPSNVKNIFLADSTLTLPEASRPASYDKVTNTGGSITNTTTELDALQYRSIFPSSYFTTSLGTSKYSELIPVTSTREYTDKKTDYNILPDEIVISSKKVIILPNTITSGKDMSSTFKGSIFEHKDFIEKETDAEYKIIYFTEDFSERVDDISSAGKITPAYVDYITIISDDSCSEYVPDKHTFKLGQRK